MKVVDVRELEGTERDVRCPNGGFRSLRILLESDRMGFTMTKTTIPVGTTQFWHYKNHLEACFCVEGRATLVNDITGESFEITPGKTYVLDNHDAHLFTAHETTTLICVFNPPLKGREVHREDGSYSS